MKEEGRDLAKYVRLGIKGTLGPQEVWSVNPVIDPAGELDFPFDQGTFNAFVAALASQTVPGALLGLMSTACKITAFRAELRDTTEEGFIGAAETTLSAPIAGTGAPTKTPQTSIVASLRSNTALASGRGRLYWPALGGITDATTLRISAANLESYGNAFSSYLTSICNLAKAQLTPVSLVNFGVSIYSPTKRILTQANRVQVGDVLDVQRRRRDSMPEVYYSASLPTP